MGFSTFSSTPRLSRTLVCGSGGPVSAARSTSCWADCSRSASGKHQSLRAAPKSGEQNNIELRKKVTTMKLKLITSGVTLAAALVLTPASYGQTASICQTGKLLDVQEDNE